MLILTVDMNFLIREYLDNMLLRVDADEAPFAAVPICWLDCVQYISALSKG
jgi:hypothetical protein